MQNNNVKGPDYVLHVWRTGAATANFFIFGSSLSLCSRFSLMTVLTMIKKVTLEYHDIGRFELN